MRASHPQPALAEATERIPSPRAWEPCPLRNGRRSWPFVWLSEAQSPSHSTAFRGLEAAVPEPFVTALRYAWPNRSLVGPQKNDSICRDFSAPRETRTPTDQMVHKALNLAPRLSDPSAGVQCVRMVRAPGRCGRIGRMVRCHGCCHGPACSAPLGDPELIAGTAAGDQFDPRRWHALDRPASLSLRAGRDNAPARHGHVPWVP